MRSQNRENQIEQRLRARLLVVDDDVPSRKMLGGILRNAGYEVTLAADGPEAIELARKVQPDVVLLDVMMPRMSGHEVCEILKNDPRTRLSQVMLVSALDGTPDKVEGLDIGADDYVTKPIRREEFLAKVRALLRVRRLLDDLESARRELAERNGELEIKKTLAQALVHDLKNPLTGVLGNLDLMELPGGKDTSTLIKRTRRAAQRMQQMVSNLIDVAALEEGRVSINRERVDLAELTLRSTEEAESIGHARNVSLLCTHVATARLDGDAQLLRRMIDNLVSNAVAHSPEGGTVAITAQPVSGGVEWTISDEGPGIPEELRRRVFDKYAQGDQQQTGVMANRGLGLTLCRMVADAHRGEIGIETAAGGGTLMRIRMLGVAPEDSHANLARSA
jgi:two-component system sensor histidine kinase/response regulator